MKKRRYGLVQRILIKANSVLYTLTGKWVDLLVKWKIYGEFPYEKKGHFGDVIRVEHPYPTNFQEKDRDLLSGWKSYETFPHDLFYSQDQLLTDDGIVLRKHHTHIKALPHPVFRFQYGILYNLKVRLLYRKIKLNTEKKYLLFYDNWSCNNYFHWIIDSLCRAQLVHEHVKGNFTIVLPEKSPKYLTETLKLYGYTDFLYLPARTAARIPELYAMNYAAWSGQQHPEILKKMANYLIAQTKSVPKRKDRKVYVSRGKQIERRVENEAELIAMLERYGFETVYFEGMPFAEQVKLMQETEVFVSSHGANMTNMIFLPKQARVLELLNDRAPNMCYWSVAASMGLSYRYLLFPLTAADHVRVDVEMVEGQIKLMN
jgi:Glycosyltransferase 61